MPETTESLRRLVRLSRTMEIVTILGIVFTVGGMVLALVIPEWTRNILLARLGQFGATLPLTPAAQAVAGLVLAVPVGLIVYGLFSVRALFRAFARGHVFTERAVRHLQVFAVTVLAQAPLGPLSAAVLSAALTAGNPPGQRAIHLTLSTNDYLALVVGGVLLAATSVMREAARMADENASFV